MTATTIEPPEAAVAASLVQPGLRGMISHTLILTRRHLLHLVRSPQVFVWTAVQPIMFVLLFNYVLGGAIDPSGRYINALIPGIIIQMVSFNAVATGIGLQEDVSKGIVDRFRSLPIARSSVLTSQILSDTARIAINVVIAAAMGALIGFRFSAGIVPTLGAFLLATAFGVAMAWVGAWIGLTIRSAEAIQSVGFIWVFPLTFLSSAFAPTQTMPGWLQAFVKVNPVTFTVDALRALSSGAPATTLVLQSLAWIIGITVVFGALAVRQYRRIQ